MTDGRTTVRDSTTEDATLVDAVLGHAPIVAWTIDRNGVFTSSRGRGLEVLGLRRDDVVGRSVFDLYADHPQILSAVRRAFEGEETQETIELRGLYFDAWYSPLRNSTGRFEPVEFGETAREDFGRDPGGDVVGVIGVATVVTERQVARRALIESKRLQVIMRDRMQELRKTREELASSEAWRKSLVENAPDFIMEIDREGTIRFINRVDPPHTVDEVEGASAYDFIPEDNRDAVRRQFQQVFDTGRPETFEFPAHRIDGALRLYSTRAAPVPCEGETKTLIVISTDVTDVRRVEEESRMRQNELAHRDRLNTVGELAAMLIHEINNPLTAVLGYTEACIHGLESKEYDREKVLKGLKLILASGGRIQPLVEGLKNYVGRRELKTAPVAPLKLIDEAASLASIARKRVGAQIQINASADLPEIEADETAVEQVLVNLLLNGLDAVKNQAARERMLTIAACRGDDDDVVFRVSDTGEGLSEAVADQVFNRFFTTKPDGLGVGLSICQSIVEAHGGWIRAENDPAGGARFTFSLPMRQSGEVPRSAM